MFETSRGAPETPDVFGLDRTRLPDVLRLAIGFEQGHNPVTIFDESGQEVPFAIQRCEFDSDTRLLADGRLDPTQETPSFVHFQGAVGDRPHALIVVDGELYSFHCTEIPDDNELGD
ncbi:MAG TPA: hypothetical protein VJP80_06145 [Candidatus Saccharimonadales bacterium]|nr:hypothetical protein [Candidatus Saccharimonadales bacterium]